MKKRKRATASVIDRRLDRLSVKIVSAVAAQMTGDKLYAYGGIEAARDVRRILSRSTLLKRGD